MKNANKKRKKGKFRKTKKMCSFSCLKDHSTQKIRFLGQKVCSVACEHTDGHTDTHKSEYRGHPFTVSGIFPSTYHQGSVQLCIVVLL